MRFNSINDVPPGLRKQVEEKLEQRKATKVKQERARAGRDEFDSVLERDYYLSNILPKVQNGALTKCELHRTFEILPPREYCGKKLPAIKYTPDFILYYPSGYVEVIEVKSKAVRKLQKGYTYRRRLFIEYIAEPQAWGFREDIF